MFGSTGPLRFVLALCALVTEYSGGGGTIPHRRLEQLSVLLPVPFVDARPLALFVLSVEKAAKPFHHFQGMFRKRAGRFGKERLRHRKPTATWAVEIELVSTIGGVLRPNIGISAIRQWASHGPLS